MSILLHGAVAVPVALRRGPFGIGVPAAGAAVRFEVVDNGIRWRGTDDPPETYNPPEKLPDRPVVDAPPTSDDRPPPDARFVSAANTRTGHEMVSGVRVTGRAATRSRVSLPEAPLALDPGRGRGILGGAPGPDALRQPVAGASTGTLDFGPPSAETRGGGVRLAPSRNSLSGAVAGTGLGDFGETPRGVETLLNSIQWRHAPFFIRVQKQVEDRWNPARLVAERDPSGNIYGFRDRETLVRVVLDRNGSLRRAYVVSSSGVDFLDDEAVAALERATPVPRPPSGLVDPESGLVAFFFRFVVLAGERPLFQLRQY